MEFCDFAGAKPNSIGRASKKSGNVSVARKVAVVRSATRGHPSISERAARPLVEVHFMLTISEALANAVQCVRTGRLQDAEPIYQQILAADPRQSVALHHLGLIAYQTGRPETAIAYLERAIELKSNDADLYNDLGNAFRQFGQLDEAAAAYLRALELRPNYPAAYNNLGIVWNELSFFCINILVVFFYKLHNSYLILCVLCLKCQP